MGKAADALLIRYVRGRMVGMPMLGYYTGFEGSDSPYDFDKQLSRCNELVNGWPLMISTIVKCHWGSERMSQRDISERFGINRRKVANIISTARYKVVRECIEPFTMSAANL